MTTSATLKYTHLSPQKMRLIADQIRGMSADRAVTLLSFSNKKGAVSVPLITPHCSYCKTFIIAKYDK